MRNAPVPSCVLCGDAARDEMTSGISTLYGPSAVEAAILTETPDLFLISAPGGITLGYMILAPKVHYTSFARLPEPLLASAESIWSEILQVGQDLALHPFVLFEHGANSERDRGPACIDHAHLHIVPLPNVKALIDQIQIDVPGQRFSCLLDLCRIDRSAPYVWVQSSSEAWCFTGTGLPSQYLRRLVAEQWGSPEEWDWRLYQRPETFWRTIETFKGLIGTTGESAHDH